MSDPESLKQVLLEQQSEIAALNHASLIQREGFAEARGQMERSWIKVIIGIRRCGKSIFGHQLLAGTPYAYVNFDDERLIQTQTEDLNLILQTLLEIKPGVKTLFFDEIQNVPGWELFANRLHRQKYNLLITGSNSKLLSKELATHLTGRHVSLSLTPFSFSEFLKVKNCLSKEEDFFKTEKKAEFSRLFDEYISFGGFPEMAVDGFDAHYLRDLYDKIITRDITDRYKIKYVKTLKELALYSFSNLGNRITYHKLKNTFELNSVHTVKNYMQYLEDAYLIRLVQNFSFKVKEQVRQPRKLYTLDNGMARSMSPKFTADRGAALENLVFQELNRRGGDLFFWSTPETEVDFVVKSGLNVSALIQVCESLADIDTRKREMKGLIKASEATGCTQLNILTRAESGEEKIGRLKIKIQPVWQWLLTH